MPINQIIILAWGWKRYCISCAAGFATALALAPFNLCPLIFVTIPIAIWLIDSSGDKSLSFLASGKQRYFLPAAIAGWWFGFGYFVAGLWWLGAPILIEGGDLLWVLPFAIFGLPAFLAIFIAFAFGFARLFWSERPDRIIIFSISMSAAEWLRGHILTGFPWNNFGMVLGDWLYFAQSTSILGIYGLTFIILLIASAPATLWDISKSNRRIIKPFISAIIALLIIYIFGVLRLYMTSTDFDHDVRLRIMQPNITNDQFRSDRANDILNSYFKLSDQRDDQDHRTIENRTHLIWPESAFPFVLAREPRALERIKAFLPPQVTLLTGAARAQSTLSREFIGDTQTVYYNSIQAFYGGEIKASVDKFHLVPFGEYLPFKSLLEQLGLRHLVHIPGGFEAGDQQHLLDVPGLPHIAPLICYEAIFSGEVVPSTESRPSVLLNVTNDSWFAFTSGPYQHFSQARLRAIEEGLPLIRAANTGISAVIDPYGRIIKSLALGEEGYLDSDLPKPITPTVFAIFGNKILLTLWIVALLFWFWSRRQFDQT
jgi:apolipoprotein N-acyltransferase